MPPTDLVFVGTSLPVPLGPSNEPPTEFPVWALGETRFRWADGGEHAIDLTPELAERLLASYQATGRQLAIDYNHASLRSVDDREARAAGWFDLELRDDGLWAVNVSWTETAAAYLRAREYRYTSPVWGEDETGPSDLLNLALTINPATLGAMPLVASRTRPLTAPAVETPPSTGAGEEHTVGDRATVRVATALGLPETAPETDVALRAAALHAFEATVLAELGAPDRETAVAQIEAQRADLQAASARVSELERQADEQEREQLITAAVRDGRLTPAQAAEGGWARSQSASALREFLATAPRVVPTGEVGEASGATEKSFRQMSGPERAQLYLADKDRYLELRQADLGY